MRASILIYTFAGVASAQPNIADGPLPVPSPEDICTVYNDCRPLTAGEALLGEIIYGSAIDFDAVRIVNGRYLGIFPIGDQYTGIAPDGNIYVVARSMQSDDYSKEPRKAPFFVHELFHIKQRNEGLNLLGQAFSLHAMSSASPYAYVPKEGTTITDYNFEQQASMAADAYTLGQHLHSGESLFADVFKDQETDEKCVRFKLLDQILITANVMAGPMPDLCR